MPGQNSLMLNKIRYTIVELYNIITKYALYMSNFSIILLSVHNSYKTYTDEKKGNGYFQFIETSLFIYFFFLQTELNSRIFLVKA